jgi:hypothetical protein
MRNIIERSSSLIYNIWCTSEDFVEKCADKITDLAIKILPAACQTYIKTEHRHESRAIISLASSSALLFLTRTNLAVSIPLLIASFPLSVAIKNIIYQIKKCNQELAPYINKILLISQPFLVGITYANEALQRHFSFFSLSLQTIPTHFGIFAIATAAAIFFSGYSLYDNRHNDNEITKKFAIMKRQLPALKIEHTRLINIFRQINTFFERNQELHGVLWDYLRKNNVKHPIIAEMKPNDEWTLKYHIINYNIGQLLTALKKFIEIINTDPIRQTFFDCLKRSLQNEDASQSRYNLFVDYLQRKMPSFHEEMSRNNAIVAPVKN